MRSFSDESSLSISCNSTPGSFSIKLRIYPGLGQYFRHPSTDQAISERKILTEHPNHGVKSREEQKSKEKLVKCAAKVPCYWFL